MKSLILLLICIKISSSTSQDTVQYCNGGECEELLQYDELVISDICFNEKIIQFNNSRGILYRGLTNDKKVTETVSFCDSNKSITGGSKIKSQSSIFNPEKLVNAHIFLKEFINDVNDMIYISIAIFNYIRTTIHI